MSTDLIFKIATEPEEFEQIHRLNYRTFVEEIPQHPANSAQRLVDKFHRENSYVICRDGTRLVGMLALRGNRPFSLDRKVSDLDAHLPKNAVVCELRLLAVEPEYRRPGLFARLIRTAAEECIGRGYTLAVASGTIRQTRLYRRMGFVPFTAPVGTQEAMFQPMYLTLDRAVALFNRLNSPVRLRTDAMHPISFMPGPVQFAPEVRHAFADLPISHRSEQFLTMVADLKQRLCSMTGAAGVELLTGSGTTGNDAVAANLKLLAGKGLVLSAGEFGDRLINHAERQGLAFTAIRLPWGDNFDLEQIERQFKCDSSLRWLWAVHCETSTGSLLDLPALSRLCHRYQVRLCLDCTSSLGTVPTDLSGVYLASSVSGKGLASFPGLALLFYNHVPVPDNRLPRSFDLGYYHRKQGVPFTLSSNLVAALRQSLRLLALPERYADVQRRHDLISRCLADSGLTIFGNSGSCSPAVIGIRLPGTVSSQWMGEEMERLGYLLSFRSSYLLERNIIQICLMGTLSDDQCLEMAETLLQLCRQRATTSPAPRTKSMATL